MIHDFRKSIIVGETGEDIIKKYLKTNPKVISFQDVSKDHTYQDQDIDLIILFQNNSSATIEIKTDTYTSGNIFYETISNIEYNVPGCMIKSKADYLFYYFIKTRELYIIDFKKYRIWFEANKYRFDRKTFENINKQRTGTYHSEGYTIPKKFLEETFRGYKKIIL